MKRYIPIQLDKMRNMRYGMEAISLIETKLGSNISKIDFNNLSMYHAACCIWAGLVRDDSSLTPETVMKLVDDYSDLPTVLNVMGDAMNSAFGIPDSNEIKELVQKGMDNVIQHDEYEGK